MVEEWFDILAYAKDHLPGTYWTMVVGLVVGAVAVVVILVALGALVKNEIRYRKS